MAYKLSSVLRGHEKDVRGICKSVFPSGGLISVSRDRTSRVWKKDEYTSEFIEGQCFSGHQGFVAAVCTMPESEKYPHGRQGGSYVLYIGGVGGARCRPATVGSRSVGTKLEEAGIVILIHYYIVL